MTQTPPDLSALARRYVELWQDQLAAVAADPEMADTLARWLKVAGGNVTASAAMWQSLWPAHDGAAPPGPASAAAAPADGSGDVAQLSLRLAALEARIAALEAGPGRAGGEPFKGPRRRRPA
ncbi:MAG TPA: hypothetical protein VKS60_21295 [Stellaceae bacterium]|nr:hypothetical protein [Stellaceae bacterium]